VSRFAIGAMLPVAYIAYFATPADILVKLLVVPTAILGVVFPAIAAHSVSDKVQAAQLVGRGIRVILLLMVPPTIILVALPYEILTWWIDSAFALAAGGVLRWLAIGALVTGVASLAAVGLAGANRPELTALPPLLQLPFFAAGVWWVLQSGYGIVGVAIVLVVRTVIDGVIMAALLSRVLPFDRLATCRVGLVLTLAALAIGLAAWPGEFQQRIIIVCLSSILFVLSLWRLGTDSRERAWMKKWAFRESA